ncbi:DUF427 domain-containing protein [Phenylobacterium kunshanense]|uniref:DUF427 domain-containing protein n=1 Tax=Phenylobacterium kunshanense TaxID=1445034 RepID=A0A328BB95_9CAUL|nr:DUF427 domain-containing protein [Phenylobacterium kunshanense]RAK64317.1 DUF427 domain-containing protein [Phenylobacterium kunshanense]
MMTPGPDHPITLTEAPARWRARYRGHVIADSDHAILLSEAGYPQVVYFPRADVEMAYFGRTSRTTTCPYKGDASYWTLDLDGGIEENVAWSYETPHDTVADIAGRIAFYADRVEVYAVDDAAVNLRHHEDRAVDRRAIDEVIQHTDSGAGVAQRDHWPPNVETPGPEAGGR